jgi:hypothetical protein
VLVLRAINHYGDDVGWHTAKIGDGWAALEPDPARYAPHFGMVRLRDHARPALRCHGRPQYNAPWIIEVPGERTVNGVGAIT